MGISSPKYPIDDTEISTTEESAQMPKKIFFLGNRSIKVPAYKPQKSVMKVAIEYMVAKVEAAPRCLAKYQGIASILIP